MLEIVGTVLAALIGAGLFKGKKYCLWVKRTAWLNTNPAGNSARNCKKARAVLIGDGWPESSIMILAKGITPPIG